MLQGGILVWIVGNKENMNIIITSKKYMIYMFPAALFTIATTWKPKSPPSDEWIKKSDIRIIQS